MARRGGFNGHSDTASRHAVTPASQMLRTGPTGWYGLLLLSRNAVEIEGRSVRRSLGILLVLIGVFGIAMAILLPTVVVAKSKKTPLDLKITQVSSGQAKIYDAATGETSDVEVRATRKVHSDSAASDSDNTTVDESLCIVIVKGDTPNCLKSTDPRFLKFSTDRVTTDRKTGEAVHVAAWNENVDGNTSVRHEGMAYKFPIDTEKKTYQFFSPDLAKAFPAKYVGEDTIRGLKVYKFECKTGSNPYKVQGTFDGHYTDTRTVWVEPRTGAILNGEEHQIQTILDKRTNKTITALDARFKFTKGAIDYQSNFAQGKIDDLKLAQVWGPIIAGVVGVLALVGAFLLLRGRRGRSDEGGVTGQHRTQPDAGPETGEPEGDPNEQTRPVGSMTRGS